MFLHDAELNTRLRSGPPLVDELDLTRAYTDGDSQVQAASIDLTMGNIFIPEVASAEFGGIENPRTEYSLDAGHTAVVETAERLHMPEDLGAICFLPSSVSARGILTTNPGHVDPGYDGHLSFTVINMGKKTFELKPRERIVTLLFFELDNPPTAAYEARHGPPRASAVSAERLARLSHDFLQVEARAREVAADEERKTRNIVGWVGALAALATVLVALSGVSVALLGVFLPTRDDVQDVRGDVKAVKEQLNVKDFEERLRKLESQRP